ncbi:M81 family metallopeptidase [Mesorhizobium sp. BAC0120]|uniref:M81 family metallopeptidase n=1 Tax=Mesorhizobium sp. BAC0120 TaxID=3090670 RepID=UPI00298BD339|nr:M81 family metallopeptidase [Mesorhizobium sp. BAC0120]MDW6022451.1 M81 family metallopeptidase [Mesorhizobium sp. BAC0120]
MRIAIVGLSIEIMLASPVATDTTAVQRYDAEDMLAGDVWMVRGMLARLAEEPDIEAVPLFWATALPGGPMTAAAYDEIKSETIRRLIEGGPFDGVLVANHGALEVAGMDEDADTDFVAAIRSAVGPQVPIGVSLDLHGDMTPGLLSAATVFSVLRTAPHRDDRETGWRAADQLVHVIRSGIRPKKAAVRIPILVPGETAVTALRPARELYGSLPEYDARSGILEANILVGFAWNDRPSTAVTAFAVSDGDAAAARNAAVDLAASIWAERSEFRLRMETAETAEGLRRALDAVERPVFVSDSGDNTTAGAAGDLTFVLQAALDDPQASDIVVAGITAPLTVERLIAAGVGAEVEIVLGAEHVSRPRTERRVIARVEACGETLELGGFQPYRSHEGAWACVRIGGVLATFHARAIGITTPHHFTAMGIQPTAHKAYVVKLGYLHPQLEDIAARHILLLSDGVSQLDMRRLDWSALPRPTYPLDTDFDWTPEDGLYGD